MVSNAGKSALTGLKKNTMLSHRQITKVWASQNFSQKISVNNSCYEVSPLGPKTPDIRVRGSKSPLGVKNLPGRGQKVHLLIGPMTSHLT